MNWFRNRIWNRYVITSPCRGGCEHDGPHDTHMTRFGWWWLTRVRR